MSDTHPIPPHGGTLVDLLAGPDEAESLRSEARNLAKVVVSERELADLEVLTVGALSPLTGFQGEQDHGSILETMHLPNGLPWSIPVTLSLSDEEAKRLGGADRVALLPSALNRDHPWHRPSNSDRILPRIGLLWTSLVVGTAPALRGGASDVPVRCDRRMDRET